MNKNLQKQGFLETEYYQGKVVYLWNSETEKWSKHPNEMAAANHYLKNQFKSQNPFNDF